MDLNEIIEHLKSIGLEVKQKDPDGGHQRNDDRMDDNASIKEPSNLSYYFHNEENISPTVDLLAYHEGYVGECVVSHISENDAGHCYIVDLRRTPNSTEFLGNCLKPLTEIPRMGDIFAYQFHGTCVARALRVAPDNWSLSASNGIIRAILLDVGNTVYMTNDLQCKYRVTELAKNASPRAILCKIVRNRVASELKELLHRKIYFKIIKMGMHSLHVELIPANTNPFSSFDDSKKTQDEIDEEFYQLFRHQGVSAPLKIISEPYNYLTAYNELSNNSRSSSIFGEEKLPSHLLQNNFDDKKNIPGASKPFQPAIHPLSPYDSNSFIPASIDRDVLKTLETDNFRQPNEIINNFDNWHKNENGISAQPLMSAFLAQQSSMRPLLTEQAVARSTPAGQASMRQPSIGASSMGHTSIGSPHPTPSERLRPLGRPSIASIGPNVPVQHYVRNAMGAMGPMGESPMRPLSMKSFSLGPPSVGQHFVSQLYSDHATQEVTPVDQESTYSTMSTIHQNSLHSSMGRPSLFSLNIASESKAKKSNPFVEDSELVTNLCNEPTFCDAAGNFGADSHHSTAVESYLPDVKTWIENTSAVNDLSIYNSVQEDSDNILSSTSTLIPTGQHTSLPSEPECVIQNDGMEELEELKQLELIEPWVGKVVKILPTYVVDVEQFYAQFPIIETTTRLDRSAREMRLLMNMPEKRNGYVLLEGPPVINELVLVKYNDDVFYRAKVINRFDIENFKVFYLDYGNCSFVKASQVYKWDAMWSSIPFRAYLCRLNGVKKVRCIDYVAINYFKEIALSKELQATILKMDSQTGQVTIQMLNEENESIADVLCEYNFALPDDTLNE